MKRIGNLNKDKAITVHVKTMTMADLDFISQLELKLLSSVDGILMFLHETKSEALSEEQDREK